MTIEISIIIPTLNRENTLRTTLHSLLKQQDLNGVEVLVIDNGSNDNTAEVCKEFINEQKVPVQYHYDAEPGLLTGRHLGASLATGNILCFLDDDVELDSTWLDGVREGFNDREVQLATGPSLPKYEMEPPDWLKYFWQSAGNGKTCHWLSLIDLGNTKKTVHPTLIWGLNFCIRKNALQALGGFHPDNIPSHLQMYQGDGETGLTLKADALNYKCLYHPQIKLYHLISKDRLTMEHFKKRAFYQGVCHSYTAFRQQHFDGRKRVPVLKHALKKILSPLKQAIKQEDKNLPQHIIELKDVLDHEEKKGFLFHQEAFKNNEEVKEWVLKKNYWDYKLPH